MGKDEIDLIDGINAQLAPLAVICDYLAELTAQTAGDEKKRIILTYEQMDDITTAINTSIANIKRILEAR